MAKISNMSTLLHVHMRQLCQNIYIYMPTSISDWKHQFLSDHWYTSHELNAIKHFTTSTGIHTFHFILLTYAPEQICLPYHICIYHCSTTVVYIEALHYCICYQKQVTQWAFSLAVICRCTIHLATIFILYHQWPFMYYMFGRHIFCILHLCQWLWKFYTCV